jgi:hypothetical protein
MKTTRYFSEEVILKRPYLKLEWIEGVLANPIQVEKQEDGRIRTWGYVGEIDRVIPTDR